MYQFGLKDSYKVVHLKKNEKQIIDYKVLVRLYAPLIGSVALSTYLTLDSELSLNKNAKSDFYLSRLTNILQISIDELNKAFDLLKEYQLLSYKFSKKSANDCLFVLHPTLKASEIFANDSFVNSLKVVMGDFYYNQVKDYFLNNYIDEAEYVDAEEIKINQELTEEEFYERFASKYPVINDSWLVDEKAKKEIARLKKLFKLSYDDVENAILNSFVYDSSNTDVMLLDLNKLNNFVSEKFSKKEENKDDKIIASFEQERSLTLYQRLAGRDNLLPRETAMISELLDTYKISEGILNVVITYYYQYTKNTNCNPKNYFIKIIENMLIENVSSTAEAIAYFRNRKEKIASYKNNNEVKVEVAKKEVNNEEIDNATLERFKKLMQGE